MSGGGPGSMYSFEWIKSIPRIWEHDVAEDFTKWLLSWHIEPLLVAPVTLFILTGVALGVDPGAVEGTGAMLVALSPLWLPVYLAVFFWTSWMHYIRYVFWFQQQHILLEIELPPEVEKSPQAMELVLTTLWNAGGESTFIARIWNGSFRPIFSLEIASNEGRIGFYIHARRSWKNIIESRMYGQFPEARVHEVEDYSTAKPFNDLSQYDMWGAEYTKSDIGALPIRTYIDYELNKDTDKPETRVDPITNTLELMNTMGEGEHMWMQMILKARKSEEWYGFYLDFDAWTKPARQKITDILKGAAKRAKEVAGLAEDEEGRVTTQLTSGEKLQIDSIEHSLTKLVFDTGIRVLYVAKNAKFNGIYIGSIVRFFDAYKYNNLNALGITGSRGMGMFDYPWQDWNNIRRDKVKQNMLFQYKHRAYFYVPYDQIQIYLTTEEVATLWHFPNSMVKTPGLQRVPSRVSEAPLNLPV